MKNFQGNYIKRISFYAGLIAFFVALGFSIFTYFRNTLKEGESLIENAQSSLAPYIKWYQEDSSKELERYRNLSKAEFEKLDVDLIIEKNLQDIKNIFEDVDILTRFDFLDENELGEISIQGMKSANYKLRVLSFFLEKERQYNPKNTYFILNNSKRYQEVLEIQAFLKSKIEKEFLDKENKCKISLHRIAYLFQNINIFMLINSLILSDIENHTCQINSSIIQNTLAKYHFIQESTKVLFNALDNKISKYATNDKQKEKAMQTKEFLITYWQSANKGQSTIQAIQSNLKKCK